MFGLLTHRPQQPVHRADFRKSYCGTCKAIGTMYGHKERMLLNNDVVFLSELLAELSNRSSDFEAITVNRCFSLPKHQSRIPPFLAYTASANILLAGIKIQDNIEDKGNSSAIWRFLAWMQKSKFGKARNILEHWGLDMLFVEQCVAGQWKREKEEKQMPDIAASCSYYAELTGTLSGEIFRQAASTTGKPEAGEDLYQIGKSYGEIVYLADAVKDYAKDLKRGEFNPFRMVKGITGTALPEEAAEAAFGQIAANMLILRRHLYQLPIAEQKKQSFAERLEASIYGAMNKQGSCNTSAACHSKRITIYEKYLIAYTRAKQAFTPGKSNLIRNTGFAVAAGLFALVLLAFPLRTFAAIAEPSPAGNDWQDPSQTCCDDCCDAICDSLCDSLCNAICN